MSTDTTSNQHPAIKTIAWLFLFLQGILTISLILFWWWPHLYIPGHLLEVRILLPLMQMAFVLLLDWLTLSIVIRPIRSARIAVLKLVIVGVLILAPIIAYIIYWSNYHYSV